MAKSEKISVLFFITLKPRNGWRKCTLLRGQPDKAQTRNKLQLLELLQNVIKFLTFYV